MSLTELVDGVETHSGTHTSFDADEASVATLCDRFAADAVEVRGLDSPDVPGKYAALGESEEFVTATRVPDVLDSPDPGGLFDDGVGDPDDALGGTAFATFDADGVHTVSRRIEDRAWRVGNGRLHAGVQTLDALADELDVYQRLAGRSGLHVDAYAAAEGTVPDHDDSLAVHVERADEIRSTRFVAYDGGGRGEHKCALVVEEREPDAFCGFWTYDPDTVDYVCSYLRESYPLIPA